MDTRTALYKELPFGDITHYIFTEAGKIRSVEILKTNGVPFQLDQMRRDIDYKTEIIPAREALQMSRERKRREEEVSYSDNGSYRQRPMVVSGKKRNGAGEGEAFIGAE